MKVKYEFQNDCVNLALCQKHADGFKWLDVKKVKVLCGSVYYCIKMGFPCSLYWLQRTKH